MQRAGDSYLATRVDWRGGEVFKATERAAQQAIDETMAEGVKKAAPAAPVDTRKLQRSIRFEPARIQRDHVSGFWGSFNVLYALYQEAGFHTRNGRWIEGKSFLRNAASEEYPKLAGRIKDRL